MDWRTLSREVCGLALGRSVLAVMGNQCASVIIIIDTGVRKKAVWKGAGGGGEGDCK